jgi:hypothetical protein
MENLRLLVFENESEGSESLEKPSVHFGKKGEIIIRPLQLCDDGTIIYI